MANDFLIVTSWDGADQWDWSGYWDLPTRPQKRPPEVGFCNYDNPQTAYKTADKLVIKGCEGTPPIWLNNSL
jgi:hypothetical protein